MTEIPKDHDPQPLTPEEIRETAERLRRLPKGFLPLEIFLAVAEKVATPTIDVAPLRTHEGRLQVFMLRRPDDDEHWPGQWHIPGTVLRATDEENSFNSGLARLFDGETEGLVVPVGEPKHVGTKFWDVERGRELDHLHYVEVEALSDDLPGQFFPVDELPDDTIAHHKIIIPEIVDAYLKDKEAEQ